MSGSDLIHNDFETFQLTENLDQRFPLGQVLIETHTARKVQPSLLQQCVRRHASGDWGRAPAIVQRENAITVRRHYGMPIVSHFTVGNGRLQITTAADGTGTSIVLYEAREPSKS